MWTDNETYVLPLDKLTDKNYVYFIKEIKQDTRINDANRTEGEYWPYSTFNGEKCVRSIEKMVDNQRVDLYINYHSDVPHKVILEFAVDSETYDNLRVWRGLSGSLIREDFNGKFNGWIKKTYDVPAGDCIIQFGYVKDGSNSSYSDAAYIKSIVFKGIKSGIDVRWCIKDGTNYKVFNQTDDIVDIGTSITKDIMLGVGMKSMPTPRHLMRFVDPSVVQWISKTDDYSIPNKLLYRAVPYDRLLVQKDNVAFTESYIKSIKSVSALCNKSETASLLFVFSVDDGLTWRYFRDGVWAHTTLTAGNVREYGTPVDKLQIITEDDWNSLLSGSEIIKCACAMYVVSSKDFIQLKNIKYNFVLEEV